MSRLDDELKLMFQRQEPSADFAERVLAQVNRQAQPKESLWQRLISFFQPNAMRWAVAATAVLLIAVIGFVQYQRFNQKVVDKQAAGGEQVKPHDPMVAQDQTKATGDPNGSSENPENGSSNKGVEQNRKITVEHRKLTPHRSQRLTYVKESSVKQEEAIARQRKSDGEMAKEQLMKALSIASATVNEAKKLAIGSD